MRESFVQFVVTVKVKMTPEEFIEKYNTILIRDIDVCVHAINDNSTPLTVESFEVTGIEKAM